MMSRIAQTFFAESSMHGPLFAMALFFGMFVGLFIWFVVVKRGHDFGALESLPLVDDLFAHVRQAKDEQP